MSRSVPVFRSVTRGFVALTAAAAIMAAIFPSAQAMNWEGHDEWFHETFLFERFTNGVPPPIRKPLPSCDERKRAHAANSYEQIAVPGLNCHTAPALSQ